MQDTALTTPNADPSRRGRSQWTDDGAGQAPYSTPGCAAELVQKRARLDHPPPHRTARRRSAVAHLGAGRCRCRRAAHLDTGAGLTRQEIHDYLATVGVGYTRGLRQGGEDDEGLIGMFGLGFLSAGAPGQRAHHLVPDPDLGHLYVQQCRAVHGEACRHVRSAPRWSWSCILISCRWPTRRACTRCWAATALLSEPIFIGAATEDHPEPPPWRDQGMLPCIRCRPPPGAAVRRAVRA